MRAVENAIASAEMIREAAGPHYAHDDRELVLKRFRSLRDRSRLEIAQAIQSRTTANRYSVDPYDDAEGADR